MVRSSQLFALLLLCYTGINEAQLLLNRVSSVPSTFTPFDYFDIDLVKGLSITTNGNWVASPVSIKSALGLLLEGSSKNTAREITQVLRLPANIHRARARMHNFQQKLKNPQQIPGVEVIVANKLFTQKNVPVKKEYNLKALEHYKAETKQLDFSNPSKVSKEINTWVREQTNNYITEIVQPDDIKDTSVLFIVNAIYFKGSWKNGFSPRLTRDANFYISPGSQKVVKMMFTSGSFKIGRIERLNSQVIELPYENPRYSMVVVLPDDRFSLSRVTSDLPYNPIIPILDNLQEDEVDLGIPKFTITYNIDLVPVLKMAGLRDLFSDNAELTDLVETNAKVTSFIHQAKVEVNENGTIAAAATAVNVQLLSASHKRRFIANRPFLFFIRDRESSFLFNGQVVDPSDNLAAPDQNPIPSRPKARWANYAL